MADKTFHSMFPTTRRTRAARRDELGETVVIGLGRFGSSLARTLVDMGHEVLGVDADAELVDRHKEWLTHVVEADTTEERTLRQIGVADVHTAVVCIGSDVEASVLTAVALVDIGVPKIWAKAITEQHAKILERVGTHHVVRPEADMGARVAHMLSGSVLEYLALDEDFVIAEMGVPSNLAGVSLGDAGLRAAFRVTVVCIKPAGALFTYAERNTVMGADDLIVVAGHRQDVERFANA
ncbi:TrkA family potassium uptake protein [soil metagenome]